MLSRLKSKRGFSLIELAVVLIVIGVIAAIAIPTFLTVIDRSRQKAVTSTAQATARNIDALGAFNPDGAPNGADLVKAKAETDTSYTVTIAATNDKVEVEKDGKFACITVGTPDDPATTAANEFTRSVAVDGSASCVA